MEFTTCAFNRYFGNSLHNFFNSSVYPSGHVIHYMSVCLSVCVSMCGGQSIHSCKRKGGERKPEVLSDRFRCLQYQRDVYSFM